MADYMKPVVFKLGKYEYGVDIELVQSIEKGINIVPVPNSNEYISGIVNLRGEVIPAYNLKKKFNVQTGTSDNESIIIVSLPEVKLALEVDEVLEISDIDADKIVPMPILVKGNDTEYLDRVANSDGQLIILLDIKKLLNEEETAGVKEFTEQLADK